MADDSKDKKKSKRPLKRTISTWGINPIRDPNKELLESENKDEFANAVAILKRTPNNLELLSDDNGKTAAHYAAMENDGETQLAELIQIFGTDCLTSPDIIEITPLHLSARYHSAQSWEQNFNAVKTVNLFRLRDANGDTCAHWAAQNSKDYKMMLTVKKIASTACLKWKNNRNETVLHRVFQYCKNDVIEEIMKEIGNLKDILGEEDMQGNTMAHFAAKNSSILLLEIDAIKSVQQIKAPTQSEYHWLKSKNKLGETVLHLALQHNNEEVATELIEKLNEQKLPNWYKLKDEQGNTCLHAAAQHPERDAVLLKAVKAAICQRDKGLTANPPESQSPPTELDFLMDENKQKSTVLHYAVENCRLETVRELLNMIKEGQSLQIADKEGNTIFHIAAQRTDKSELLETMLFREGVDIKKALNKRNNKNQSVLHLAIDVTEETSSVKLNIKNIIKEMTKEDLSRTDIEGNTLLHSLMQSKLTYDGFEQHILDRFTLLVSEGVDVEATNNLSLNCLHATKLDALVLCKLLDKVHSDKTARSYFDKLLVNSKTGAHIIHTFSGQYKLDQPMLKSIENISESTTNSLLKKKVQLQSCKNSHHGETCLHFACAYGHQENIIFLLEKGLSLWSKSHSGQTCVDYAIESGNFFDFRQAMKKYNKKPNEDSSSDTCTSQNKKNNEAGSGMLPNVQKQIKMTDVWRLLDPPRRALKLPNRSAARMTLVSITNHYSTNQQKKDKIVLTKTLEWNSKKLFRAALSLEIITRETERQFTQYFIDTVTNNEEFQRAFPRLNTFKHLTHVDSTSELALLDLATFFHRDEILPDLILTRQFELIPCCLSLLIQLEPEIIKMRAKAKGKHEQLLQVKSKITNIAVNALNELFLNANIIEFQLLSKYIKGEMKHKENLALNSEAAAMKKNRDCLGPKFPYRDFKEGKIQYGSVLELVKKADNPDLYATDCIYSVIKEEWRKPISDCSKRGLSGSCLPCDCCHSACSCRPKISRPDSPLARFWTHFVAFIGFLVFFGWYVINFEESFLEPKWDTLLVAYLFSFGLQEASEIWRLRKARENCKIGSHVRSVPAYIVDGLNIFDALAILLLLTGLVARWLYYGMGFQLQDAYPSQVVLCVSYSLFCFRSVTFLTYFETIGPMINMLWNLIVYDLLPFLVVLFVIFCCFGVFFVCLLFSNAWTPTEEIATLSNGWETFIQAATLPFNLLFGNFDQIGLSYSPDSTELGKVAIKQGYEWFNYFVIFLFMGLVNVVMMNLLIALFNLRVTQIYGVAIGVWRKRFFQMLDEYQELTQFPPPLSFLEYIYNFLMKKFCPKNAVTDDKASRWPNDTEDYPEEYNRFLKFQAIQFRRCRSRLLLDTEWNRNDFDVVKAHTGKELSELKAELQEMLDDANTQGQGKMVE
uniref:ANK_REP_REGION domain-containing protein n=1 Tax=Macrostomum lignano TaxID=282301 RepID=A0A1I8G0G2_9PLAT